MQDRLIRPILAVLAAAVILAAGGCNPPTWQYNVPPTSVRGRDPNLGTSDRRVAVIGDFRNPANPLGWTDVGAGVSRTLSQALMNEGDFDVWYNPGLARQVQEVLDGPTTARARRLAEVHDRHRDVRYVIVGSVTDFHHTGEVPREARRRFLIFWTRKEALAAVDFTVVDLKARRVVIADHVYGLARSGGRKQAKVYENLEYGSYLFWNSPLGRATEAAVDKAMRTIDRTVPGEDEAVRITAVLADRRLRVAGEGLRGLGVGDDLFVAARHSGYGVPVPVMDYFSLEPLRARIIAIDGDAATVFIRGNPPRELKMADITLLNRLPEEPWEDPPVAGAVLPEDDVRGPG